MGSFRRKISDTQPYYVIFLQDILLVSTAIMNKLLFLTLLLLGTGCNDRVVAPDVTTDEEAIHIAFFAELISEAPSTQAEAYCLSLGDWPNRQDPTDDVIADLRNLFGNVEPASTCVYAAAAITFDGDPARAYHLDPFTVVGQTADVTGFWADSDTERDSYMAHIEKQGDFWVVTQFEPVTELH
jgi:hypothetical protein